MDNGASSYRRFLDGDDSGFVEIIKEYKDGLIFYLCGFSGDVHTAEDLAEDTFVKIITKKPRYSERSSFKTWLYAIGRNTPIDAARRSRRESGSLSIDREGNLAGGGEDLLSTYLREERRLTVHRALGRLKPEYRQILRLVYFEELSCKEAAKVMKKSVHSIETLAYRARQSLKSELEKEGFTDENLS